MAVNPNETNTTMYDLIDELGSSNKTSLIFTNTRSGTESVLYNLKRRFPEHYNSENVMARHNLFLKNLVLKQKTTLKKAH